MRNWSRRRRVLLLVVGIAAALSFYSWFSGYRAWKRALRAAGFVDEMTPPGRGDRVLVVAPHPDDEALGCAGLIQQAVANGATVDVLVMTNGDASEFAVVFGEREVPWKPANMINLGRTRQQESLKAMRKLGVTASRVHFLGYPNNGMVALWRPEHWLRAEPYTSPYTHANRSPYANTVTAGAAYAGEQVLSDVLTVMNQVRPTQIYLPHPRDVHPDHWATNCFVTYAVATAAIRGQDWAKALQLWGYLIHWPRFPTPMASNPALELLPPPELSGEQAQWYRLPIDREQGKLKLADVRIYASQEPRFDRLMLAFARQNEIFDALYPRQTRAGTAVTWRPANGRRRGLAGAEVTSLLLDVSPDLNARAEIDTASKRIPQNGYVCLDLRTWDDQKKPVITAVYIHPRGVVDAVSVAGDSRRRPAPPAVDAANAGSVRISRLLLPSSSLARRELFVTCFGSVRDRLTDPAVISRLQFAESAAPRN